MSDQAPSPWEDSDLPPVCLTWAVEVNWLMQEQFCIDLSDAGADRSDGLRYWKSGESPADFIVWFGEKYDLIARDQWDPFGVARRAIRR